MSALTLLMQILGYDDVPPTNNPTSRPIDYKVTQANIPVDNPQTQAFEIDPGATVTVVDGTRATSIDDTTAFNLSLSTVDPSRYRLTWTGAGTAPVFRIHRAVDVAGADLTLTLSPNLTLIASVIAGTPFSTVQVGDVAFIPGITTGDTAGPFNALNEGSWTVLAASGTSLTLARDPGVVFTGFSEVVSAPTTTQFLVFSTTGTQVGDTVDISAGFAVPVRRAFDIVTVTDTWIEFISSAPLGDESNVVPGAAGMILYTQRKRFIGIRTNQEISVRYNGDTGDTNRVEPLLAGTAGMEGSETKLGTVWKLVILNRSSVRAAIRVASAE